MWLRSVLLALGIGAVGWSMSGCGAGPPYATIPDATGNVRFSPDGTSMVVPALPRVYGYDVDGRSTRWTYTAKKSGVGVAFSPRGKYVLIVESEYSNPRGFALTLLRADGSPLFEKQVQHEFNPGDAGRFVNQAGRLFAISDDGAFVACGIFRKLEVFATADGSSVYTETVERGISAVAFEPGTYRLAFVGSYEPHLRVAERGSGMWASLETFNGAFDPVWTTAGLVFASGQGLELWDGKSRRTVLPADKAFPDGKATPSGEGNAPVWAASSDGKHLASWNRAGVSVWKLSDAGEAPLFTHDEPTVTEGSSQRVLLVAFAPGHFRAFTEAGDFIDLELPTGKLLRRTSFGALGSSSKALFTDGVQHTTNYDRGLSPSGRFVAVNTPDHGTKIYLME